MFFFLSFFLSFFNYKRYVFSSFLAGMDFINERLESATDVGAVREAETSISSLEDDENDFSLVKRKQVHLNCSCFWKATMTSYLHMQDGRTAPAFH